jgi:hypothetical protein
MAYAERIGIRIINLGRGAPQEKRRLGANRFALLNNWILNPSPAARSEIAILATRCREALGMVDGQVPVIGPYGVQ